MKVKLNTDHYINDTYLLAGRVIGDGTDFPFDGPASHEMEGLDEKSEALCKKMRDKFNGFESLPLQMEASK